MRIPTHEEIEIVSRAVWNSEGGEPDWGSIVAKASWNSEALYKMNRFRESIKAGLNALFANDMNIREGY